MTGNANYSSNSTGWTFYALVNKGVPNLLQLPFSPSNSVTYPTTTISGGGEDNIGDSDANYTLFLNTSGLANSSLGGGNVSQSVLLGVGAYLYIYNTSGGANYTSNAINFTLNVSKGSTSIRLFLNGTEGSRIYGQNQTANFTVLANVSGLGVNLTSNYTGFGQQNGTTSIINLTDLTALANNSNLTGWTDGNANYTGSSTTYFFNVTSDLAAPTWSGNTSTYPSTYSSTSSAFNITWVDSVSMDKVLFESNFSGSSRNYSMTCLLYTSPSPRD